MKKLVIASAVALLFSTSAVVAQERAGGADASDHTIGGVAVGTIVAGAVGIAVAAAIISNTRGTTLPITPPPTETCEGTDPLVNGACVGTTSTVTVTGTGTGTSTATMTVPVTFTYAPTLR